MKPMRRVSWMRVLCPALTAIALAALAPAADAAPKRVVEFFGNPSTAGSSLAGEFGPNSPLGVAVNGNPASPHFGDVYVVDTGNNRVQRFGSDGRFELMWGRDVIKANPEASSDLGSVYEVCSHAADCKAGAFGTAGGEFTTPRAIAVDQASGDVYVVERNTSGGARVQAFSADGGFIWAVGRDAIADGTASDPTGITTTQVCTVAAHCKLATVGVRGGEFGPGGTNSSTGGGNGVAVVPTGTLTTTPPFNNAGNVVVTDRGNRRVQELTPAGSFARAFGWDVITDASPSDPGSVNTFQVCTVAADCKEGAVGGSEAGRFGTNTPNRVAVDSTGAIYTVEHSANFRVQKFTPQAAPPGLSPAIVNPDVGAGGPALSLSGSSSSDSPLDVAVDASDHALVLRAYPVGTGNPPAEVAERRVVELDSAGVPVETHAPRAGIPGSFYIAVNHASGDIYLTTSSSPVGGTPGVYVLGEWFAPEVSLGIGAVSSHSAQLNGLVNPRGRSTRIGVRTRYRFEYRKAGTVAWTALSGDKDAGNGDATVPVAETLTGLEADTEYEARLVAFKPFSGMPASETAPEAFRTPASRPDIDAVFVTDRGTRTATLNARINPNGVATTYRFEYGMTAAYGNVAPAGADGSAGSGTSSQIFSVAIAGLQPSTTYHYRVSATSANGTNTSTDHTFTTQPETQAPDRRAYELVSPPDKVGGSGVGPWYGGIGSHSNAGIPAYEGERFASLSYYGASLIDGAFSYGSDWTLGQRTPTGWINRPAFTRPGGIGSQEFGKIALIDAASDDLSLTSWDGGGSQLAIFEGQKEAFGSSLSTTGGSALRDWETGRWEIVAPWAAGQQTANSSGMNTRIAPNGGYALISGPFRGVGGPGDPTSNPCLMSCESNVYIDDVTGGLSDTFPGDGVRSLVNVCTGSGGSRTEIPSVDGDGKVAAEACPEVAGRGRPVSPRGASLAARGSALGHISDDGSRVFFMSPDHVNAANNEPCGGVGVVDTQCPPQVYVRQRNADGSVTVRWISRSAVAGQDASLLAAAVFEGATPDGDKAFFRTASPLTADDPNGGAQVPGGVRTGSASPDSVDLYMYDFPDAEGADPGDGTLTRISAGPTGAGDANVSTDSVESTTSALRAFGEDGSRVYFTTAAPLAGVGAPASGTITTPGGTVSQTAIKNLYAYDARDRSWRFVALLPAETTLGDCAATGSLPGQDGLFAGANGTGQTGTVKADTDGNCVRTSGDASFITLFTDGRLTADDPAAPATGDVYGYDYERDELSRLAAPQGAGGGPYVCVTEDPGVGTLCHSDPVIPGLGSIRRRPLGVVTHPADRGDRVAFFESASRLVPEDVNDVYDVYQWRNGVLSLISTGAAGAEPALYRGNDRSGTNVYFSTRDRLTWQDHDAVLDVYTARVDGGIPKPPDPPMCVLALDGCQGAGAAPAVLPATQTTPPGAAGNVVERAGRTLRVGRLSRRARRAAARSGVLRLVVRTNKAGRIRAVVRARLGKRGKRRVAAKTITVRRAGRAIVRLRLNRAARRRLARGRGLRLVVRVTAPGADGRSMTVRLPGVKS